MIKEEKVSISPRGVNITYFKSKGYSPSHGKTIEVKVEDLPDKSHVKVTRQCEDCGKEKLLPYREAKNQPLCQSCRQSVDVKKPKVYKRYGPPCLDCGKQTAKKENKRCSECASKLRTGINNPMYGRTGPLNPLWQGGVPDCEICGNKVKYHNNRFCSRECMGKGNSGENNPMYGTKGEKSPNWKGGPPKCLDCSTQISRVSLRCQSCALRKYNEEIGLLLTDEERERRINHRYYEDSEARKWRVQIYQRDGRICQCCGDNKYETKMNAHHILPWSLYPEHRYDLDNGITLCEGCHKKYHMENGVGDPESFWQFMKENQTYKPI